MESKGTDGAWALKEKDSETSSERYMSLRQGDTSGERSKGRDAL